MALYGDETWMLRATDQKRLESSEMWCWRRMKKISWTDHVRNGEVLLRVNEQRNILHEIRNRKSNRIGHILRRNCPLQQVIERKINGKIEVTRRRGRGRKKLLDDLKDRRVYCQLKEEVLIRTLWRNRFRKDFGPVVWQITDDDDDDDDDLSENKSIIFPQCIKGFVARTKCIYCAVGPEYLHTFYINVFTRFRISEMWSHVVCQIKPISVGSNWANFQIAGADEITRLFLNTRLHVSSNNNFYFLFIVSSKVRMSQKCACTCLDDFPVTSILYDFIGSWFGVPNCWKYLSVRCSSIHICKR